MLEKVRSTVHPSSAPPTVRLGRLALVLSSLSRKKFLRSTALAVAVAAVLLPIGKNAAWGDDDRE